MCSTITAKRKDRAVDWVDSQEVQQSASVTSSVSESLVVSSEPKAVSQFLEFPFYLPHAYSTRMNSIGYFLNKY